MELHWFPLALISPAIWAIVVLLDDNLLRKVYKSPFVGTIISGFFALTPLLSLFFVPVTIPSTTILIFSFLAGFLLIASYWFYFKSLEIEAPSIVIALWNLTPALVSFLAFLFLGEILQSHQYIGFILILIASVGISLLNIAHVKLSRVFYFMITASVLYAVNAVILKYVYTNIDFWSGFIFTSIGMGLGSVFFALGFDRGRQFLKEIASFKKFIWIFALSELLNIAAILFSSLAISKGPVSLIKVIEGTQAMYVLLFAVLLYPLFPKYFREAAIGGKVKKLALMGLMLIGLYLIHK